MTLACCLVSHGSRAEHANDPFAELAARVAARLPHVRLAHAFLQFATPTVPEAVGALQAEGVTRVVLLPYFLHSGQHIREDLPELVAELSSPECPVTCLPSLEGHPMLEDLLVERIQETTPPGTELPDQGEAIEAESHRLIDARLAHTEWTGAQAAVVRRVIHATADFSFAARMRFHPEAIDAGLAALRAGRPILCDAAMLQTALTRTDCPVFCEIGSDAAHARAKAEGTTRAVAAMRILAPRMEGAVIGIGNAPTALFEVLRLAREEGVRPALVVGMPVGFVGARESKEALAESGLVCITNRGARGGSPAVAAALNALAVWERGR